MLPGSRPSSTRTLSIKQRMPGRLAAATDLLVDVIELPHGSQITTT
jgi:hypothetical protein